MMLKLTFNKGQGTSLKHEKERGSFRKTGFRERARREESEAKPVRERELKPWIEFYFIQEKMNPMEGFNVGRIHDQI